MKFFGRVLRLVVVALLVLAVAAPGAEAGGGRGGGGNTSGGGSKSGGGHGSGGHGGSHKGKSHGHHGGRKTVIVGSGFWWGPGWWGGPWWYYPPPYYRYQPYYEVVAEPPVYIQRQLEIQPAPQGYWHYCESAAAYYPAAQSCPEPWLRVPPRDH